MTAILVIDLQAIMFDGVVSVPIHNATSLVDNTKRILAWARREAMPVAFIRHEEDEGAMAPGAPGWHVWPALGQNEATEPTFSKTVPDAFSNHALAKWLRDAGVSRLVLLGAQTDCCVNATTLGALGLDYDVTVVADAHSTWRFENDVAVDASPVIDAHNKAFAAAGATLKTTNELVE
ncbi:hypothetical protein SPRG_12863 [Saprolegnia parasitica CBS 223.65]|uniref:Isochorismatase-like domain-containing protein n=1 Tax=Saprolegnia parasitica (strain CBS 223.65) TaxID=695850 RepID=A0A067BSY3_SAPPC|nr:hypothetical protein SPRG_12863 [Saprolegnia parasitica CBS 223.65]KDO21624.1 hypothetical protein SPRG_12863 [Saprolegnia parasitica CBS 223.65]|eukprot:XP_012207638.1 hypothetical protein SPRG_12863 [Saprolegnia parasitica CBS 223.65]